MFKVFFWGGEVMTISFFLILCRHFHSFYFWDFTQTHSLEYSAERRKNTLKMFLFEKVFPFLTGQTGLLFVHVIVLAWKTNSHLLN